MDALVRIFESIFKFGTRQGLILAIVGIAVVLGDRVSLFGSSGLPDTWRAVAVIVAIVGIVVVATNLGTSLFLRFANAAEADIRRSAAKAAYQRMQDEAVRNLDVLDEEEQIVLKFLLRTGSQRFAGAINYTAGGTLFNKRIIQEDPHTAAPDVYLVTDSVWAMRSALLKRFRDVRDADRAPWDLRF